METAVKFHFELPCNGHSKPGPPLVFDWDEETGEVSGPGRDEIYYPEDFVAGGNLIGSQTWYYEFVGPDVWKNRQDMAAIIYNCGYEVPEELKPYFKVRWLTKPTREEEIAEFGPDAVVYC